MAIKTVSLNKLPNAFHFETVLKTLEREDWMIMDDQYFSFETLSRIYSVKDLLAL